MNNLSEKNLLFLLTSTLVVSFGSILFLSSRYLDLVDKQTTYIMDAKPQNTRPTLIPQLTSVPNVISEWQKYQSQKYGFSIQFPESWQGYSVTESNSNNIFSVGFSFKGAHQPFTIFSINRYTSAQWNSLKKNSMTKLINQNDGSVLACNGCCSASSDTTGGGQFNQFQTARCKEVPSILQTLKLNK